MTIKESTLNENHQLYVEILIALSDVIHNIPSYIKQKIEKEW